jgi:hypothetical protein
MEEEVVKNREIYMYVGKGGNGGCVDDDEARRSEDRWRIRAKKKQKK